MTGEHRAASSRTDSVSLAVAMGRLEERLRGHMKAVETHLEALQKRDEAFEADRKSLKQKIDELSAKLDGYNNRILKLEYRQESSDRKKAESVTAPHDALAVMETTQRVEESKTRSRLWLAIAAGFSALAGAAASWLGTK